MKIITADPAVLYAIKCGPFFKVGRTVDVWPRLSSMQSGNPLPLSIAFVISTNKKAAPKAEYAAHCALSRYLHRDEWFRAPLHVIRSAMVKAIEDAEEIAHPGINWFPNGRPEFSAGAP